MALTSSVVATPLVTLWPVVERRGQPPPDLDEVVAEFSTPSNSGLQPTTATEVTGRRG